MSHESSEATELRCGTSEKCSASTAEGTRLQSAGGYNHVLSHSTNIECAAEASDFPGARWNSSLLNEWQGAALLTADCVGTGFFALPYNIRVLGLEIGLGFLVLQLPINYYAGYIFHLTATTVEEKQAYGNQTSLDSIDQPVDEITFDTLSSESTSESVCVESRDTLKVEDRCSGVVLTHDTSTEQQAGTTRTLHDDSGTFDYIAMASAVFEKRQATLAVTVVYYLNIFLVLGNYLLVMSHALVATLGGDNICLPTAGGLAAVGMFFVSQSGRTMAKLGRTASLVSLLALLIVVLQCLAATTAQQHETHSTEELHASSSILQKMSALGSIGFAVGSQKLFLNIRHELVDRKAAPKALRLSLCMFGTCYVVMCLAAGPNPPSFLFDAIPAGTWNRRLAGLLLWLHVAVSYAINAQALCSSMDRLLWRRWAAPVSRSLINAKPTIRWAILTSILTLTAFTVANAIPFFKDLVALIGAITSVPLTLLFPAIFWRKCSQYPLWLPTAGSVSSMLLTYFSIAFILTASLGSLYSIRSDWANHGAPFSCH